MKNAEASTPDSDQAGAARSPGAGSPGGPETTAEGSATRRRILQISLSLMSQRGVDGTSMRDLASAAGLNVASLYHYFPSKRDLLESVLAEQGFLPVRAAQPEPATEVEEGGQSQLTGSTLAALIHDIIVSMFQVDDFVRLMIGEAIRGDTTARSVGLDLFSTFQQAIEDWILTNRPDLAESPGASELARFLCAMVVGVFVEHAAGVIADETDDLAALAMQRAGEAASIIGPLAGGK